MKRMSIKKLLKYLSIAVLIGVFIIVVAVLSSGVEQIRNTLHTIFPNSLTVFNYDMEPVEVTIGTTKFAIPEAYFNSKLIYNDDGTVSQVSIWASIKDNMEPWTRSESFEKRDESAGVIVYIYGAMGDPYRSEFPYFYINNAKKSGGGQNKGEYKKLFTRYLAYPSKERIPFDKEKGLQWYKDNYEKFRLRGNWEFTRFYMDGEDTVVMEYFRNFFLIPHETDKYFITCSNSHQGKYWNCRVKVLHSLQFSYEFLIPFTKVDQYQEYAAKIGKLVDSFIINPQAKEQ